MYFASSAIRDAGRDFEGVSAVIYRADSGGPVRMIINGRKDISTGLFIAVKGGWRQLPWESRDGELAAMHVAECSSGVVSFLSQPHRLEMRVPGRSRRYDYFPDLEMSVTAEMLEALRKGVSFAEAALSATDLSSKDLTTIVLEMKGEDDRRMKEKDYLRKLELAELVYANIGIPFFVMRQDEHLGGAYLGRIRDIVVDARVAIDETDIWTARRHLELKGGRSSYAVMSAAVGGRPKLHALHVRRIVSIDLSKDIGPSTSVHGTTPC